MTDCIWYVSQYVGVPRAGVNSLGGRSFGLMRSLHKQGYRCVIITSSGPQGSAGGEYSLEEVDGVLVCRVPTPPHSGGKSLKRVGGWLSFERRLRQLPENLLPHPDVVIVSSLSLLTVENGIWLSRRYSCPWVFEVRDIWPLTLTEEGDFSRHNPLVIALGLVERRGYRKADAIVGTMPNLGEHVTRVMGRRRPTFCIPMGVDDRALSVSVPLPQQYIDENLPKGKFIVGYAGSMGISNALETLLRCAERMRDDPSVHFALTGSGALRPDYIERFGHLPNLSIAESVHRDQVPAFLSHCDLLYFATFKSRVWDYGLSLNKLIDYMWSGKPVVASYSGYPSMVNEANCGTFVPAEDPAALEREILRYACMSAADREEIGARGHDWLVQNRQFDQLADEYAKILRPLIQDRRLG